MPGPSASADANHPGQRRTRQRRYAGIALLLLCMVVLVPLAFAALLHTGALKAQVEEGLTRALGRPAVLDSLHASPWTGSLRADGLSIADDPQFSSRPMLQAQSVSLRVALTPLLLQRRVQIDRVALVAPVIHLVRAADGRWNIGMLHFRQHQSGTDIAHSFSSAIGEVRVTNGRVDVEEQPATATHRQTLDHLSLVVRGLAKGRESNFDGSVGLPDGGTGTFHGRAGFDAAQQLACTAHGDFEHVQLSDRPGPLQWQHLTGSVRHISADIVVNSKQVNIARLLVDGPHLLVARAAPTSGPAPQQQPKRFLPAVLTIGNVEVTDGTFASPEQVNGQPAEYRHVHATVDGLSSGVPAPFAVTLELPGGGGLSAHGRAGPFNGAPMGQTPFEADVTVQHQRLQARPGAPGLAGTASVQAHAVATATAIQVAGTTRIHGLRLSKNGSPSPIPVEARFDISRDRTASLTAVRHATIAIGKATLQVTGSYLRSASAKNTNVQVTGEHMPLTDLEAFLPAAGVHLPTGSRLEGGTLDVSLNVAGNEALTVSGPVHLEDTRLIGFNLASRLHTVSVLLGTKPQDLTGIHALDFVLTTSQGQTAVDRIALDMPEIGTVTGSGQVAAGQLNFRLHLRPTLFRDDNLNGAGKGWLGAVLGMLPKGYAARTIDRYTGGMVKNGVPLLVRGTPGTPVFAIDHTAPAHP